MKTAWITQETETYKKPQSSHSRHYNTHKNRRIQLCTAAKDDGEENLLPPQMTNASSSLHFRKKNLWLRLAVEQGTSLFSPSDIWHKLWLVKKPWKKESKKKRKSKQTILIYILPIRLSQDPPRPREALSLAAASFFLQLQLQLHPVDVSVSPVPDNYINNPPYWKIHTQNTFL